MLFTASPLAVCEDSQGFLLKTSKPYIRQPGKTGDLAPEQSGKAADYPNPMRVRRVHLGLGRLPLS